MPKCAIDDANYAFEMNLDENYVSRAGGGKGVIAAPEYDISHPGIRKQIFLDYGDFLSSLNGCYGKFFSVYLISILSTRNAFREYLVRV